MNLEAFLSDLQSEVRAEISDRMLERGGIYPFAESVFAEITMRHMAEVGMTFEPEICHYAAKLGSATLRLSGFALSDDGDQLDLFVSLYEGFDVPTVVSLDAVKSAAEHCLQFLTKCAEGSLVSAMDEADDAFSLATTIRGGYHNFEQIRIYVLTDGRVASTSKRLKDRDHAGKTIKLEIMDIERLHRHMSEGKPRDELVVNFQDVAGGPLPCVYVPRESSDYDYALTVIPGETLRFIYEKYGSRLLEANVRSFLSVTGKINKGIRDTLRDDPELFMAYNNGIVIVADEAHLGTAPNGAPGLTWLKGLQIVNGGQTTASIYFSKKKNPEIDLKRVRVPAKIIILHTNDAAAEESLISDISRYANSQNSVKQSDLSANKPFHIEIEKLSLSTYCPDGIGRWFYERASGSYNTMLSRDGSTPAKLKHIKTNVTPTSRKISKTDLAKFLNTWDKKPEIVSLGTQKNFERFMDEMKVPDGGISRQLTNVQDYKQMIAKAILFKKTSALVRPMFPAFQGNVTIYLIAILSERLGSRLDLERIWNRQDISEGLRTQLRAWAHEVNDVLHSTARGRMISEWAKKPDCWHAVRSAKYSEPLDGIAELR